MQAFQNVAWTTTLHEEPIKTSDGQSATTAHWTISDWHIPFSFDEWASKTGIQMSEQMPTENIYEYCSKRLQRPIPKKLVADAATRLDLDPGFIQPHEKMASFYILKLLAGISRRSVWKEWTKVPVQFVHPAAMQTFMGQSVTPFSIGYEIQAHSPIDQQYWLFDDTNVAVRAMGKPGRRRWFEMQFVGPSVVESIVKERQRHGNSIDTIEPYLKKNMYIKH